MTNVLRLPTRPAGPATAGEPAADPVAVRFTVGAAAARARETGALPAGSGQAAGYAGLVLADRDAAPVEAFDLTTGAVLGAERLTVVPHELLTRAGLVVLRYRAAGGPADAPALRLFRQALADAERDALGEAVRWCRRFLAGRRSAGQRLSAHPVVAHQMAGLVARAAALRQTDAAAALAEPAGRAWWVREVDGLARDLIRMAGGRSVLAGQMAQMRTALLYANRIYLDGAPCSD
ncbi:hypothetical protein [Micromonospora aurantiaca (nom. illeg.)]|uniref:hypothetical protein n=1 Tax=Micromonospora aurantiaca (nom. illeg.) TaxID=47850 RepID=UPI0034342670